MARLGKFGGQLWTHIHTTTLESCVKVRPVWSALSVTSKTAAASHLLRRHSNRIIDIITRQSASDSVKQFSNPRNTYRISGIDSYSVIITPDNDVRRLASLTDINPSDITPWVRTPLSVAMPDKTPGHNPCRIRT